MSQAPPAYESGPSSAALDYPSADTKRQIDASAYAVANADLYPTATEHYVPPTAEPDSHAAAATYPSDSSIIAPQPSAPAEVVAAEKKPAGFIARHITHRKEFKQQEKALPTPPQLPQQQQVVQPSKPLPPAGGVVVQTTYQAPPVQGLQNSVTFNIHREGWISRDCRIMCADDKTPAYHVDYPYSFFGAWHVNMRRGDAHGPTVFLINKSAVGSEFSIQDPVDTALATKIVRSGGIIGKRKHEFKAFDGRKYAWKVDSAGGDMTLFSYPEKTMVARYYRSHHTWSKQGRMEILGNGQHILDLVVGTGFCVEEWERQNR